MRWRDFNPRARMGARRTKLPTRTRDRAISIHAPAWGRDRFMMPTTRVRKHFNPRARMGARPGWSAQVHGHRHFNPRARMGARHRV